MAIFYPLGRLSVPNQPTQPIIDRKIDTITPCEVLLRMIPYHMYSTAKRERLRLLAHSLSTFSISKEDS